MYTAGKVNTCPDLKITCPAGHVTTNVYVPWDKIYMPRAWGHALMSSPAVASVIIYHCLNITENFAFTAIWLKVLIVMRSIEMHIRENGIDSLSDKGMN